MSSSDKTKLNGIAAGATANTGTVTSIATGVGLTGGTITGSGTVKAKIKSETAHTLSSATPTNTSSRQYPVGVDKDGYLSVNVPWEKYTHPTSGATAGDYGPAAAVTGSDGATINVPSITVDANGHVTAISNKVYTSKDTTYTAGTTALLDAGTDTSNRVWPAKQIADYVNGKISSVYKPQGSIAFANLPTPASANLGYVWNITDAFITTASFVEGAGATYPAGTNVMVVQSGSSYKFDCLSGSVDLSGYVQTSDLVAITNAEIDAITVA